MTGVVGMTGGGMRVSVPPTRGGTDHAHSLTSGLLGRLSRGAGAEEGGAGGDEEAAGEE